jgi:hypothetical protein
MANLCDVQRGRFGRRRYLWRETRQQPCSSLNGDLIHGCKGGIGGLLKARASTAQVKLSDHIPVPLRSAAIP